VIVEGALPSFSVRRRSLAEIVVVSVAIAAVAVRALEMPASPFALLRIVLSVAAIAFVFFAPCQTLARRAFAMLAFEALIGSLTFVLVDVPLVFDHQRQIGALAISIAERVDRFERSGQTGR